MSHKARKISLIFIIMDLATIFRQGVHRIADSRERASSEVLPWLGVGLRLPGGFGRGGCGAYCSWWCCVRCY